MPAPDHYIVRGTPVSGPHSGLAYGLGIFFNTVALLACGFTAVLEWSIVMAGYEPTLLDPDRIAMIMLTTTLGLVGLAAITRPDTVLQDGLALIGLVLLVAPAAVSFVAWLFAGKLLSATDWGWINGTFIIFAVSLVGWWLANYRDEFDTSVVECDVEVKTDEMTRVLDDDFVITPK